MSSSPTSQELIPTQFSSTLKRSLNRQTVLDEDEYTAALEHIIARDFYPSLVHLDATNEYLDALQSQDPSRIDASVRRMGNIQSELATPLGKTPLNWTGATPLRAGWDGEPPAKRRKYDASLSLDDFQARYTSEDNASFTEILDDENKRRKERYAWAFDAEKRVKEIRLKLEGQKERMLVEGVGMADEGLIPGIRQKLRVEMPAVKGLITAAGEDSSNKESEMALVKSTEKTEEAEEPVDVMAPKKDTRAAGVEAWKFKTRNSLMFGPEADDSPYHSKDQFFSNPDPKFLKPGNTRIFEQTDAATSSSSSEPPSPSRSRINAAINDEPYRPSASSDAFQLVPNLPSPTPAELGPNAMKQLMTVGKLMATPRIISADETPGTPFRISEPSSREALSHRLADGARKALRTKANLISGKPTPRPGIAGAGSMPPPSWTPRKNSTSLTPAARNLLDRSMGSAASRRASAMDKSSGWTNSRKDQDLAKVRWTPTPGRS
ncbi:nuclear protein DGCR14 [Flagelloscypha sp. PMI_526]|nr:nuclear protein DGCR14 [Flagelloscypha sp. PMI_526]